MSNQEEKGTTTDKLVDAYERMLKHTHEAIDKTQAETAPRFREILEKARDNMVELGELTREEAHKVSDYIQRDVEDAASYIAETGQDIRDWWRFDLQLIEQRMMDMFSKVADQTSLQLAQWAETARQMSLYQAGEVTGPGTLVCDRCGAETHFVKAGRIPACADCGGTAFRRRNSESETKG
ncbi:MAG: zinc ribbon-containing protein [Thiocapsa sp.]|jgi:polyhydroxyalkanoate synthesis regulator phasin/ribosomal protein L37E|nr:zinc ribbon-containing protein [Thiocapsa sp.]MCG6896592.1 zinc ribbon-containing protein [Thiocapsa sp.]MCG6983973.1 zinc ribbon-containing protein [Thiocapsa sp.]